jgi:hypothetical protein
MRCEVPLIQRFTHTAAVVQYQSTLHHELNLAVNKRCTSLVNESVATHTR